MLAWGDRVHKQSAFLHTPAFYLVFLADEIQTVNTKATNAQTIVVRGQMTGTAVGSHH